MDDTTAPAIRPIETQYAGCRFRSRLEARWAVFFDTAGIDWRYEPEGFEFADGTRYLPDFELLHTAALTRIFVEIKGQAIEIEDQVKVWSLSKHLDCEVYVLVGPPNEVIPRDCLWVYRGKGYVQVCGQPVGRGLAYDAIDAASSARFEFGESG